MTTAHRPTWKAAVGQGDGGGWSAGGANKALHSAKDLPSHTTLKLRKGPQIVENKKQALRKSLQKLQQAEAQAKKEYNQRRPINERIEQESRMKLLTQTAEVDESILNKYDDDDAEDDASSSGGWSDNQNGGGSGVDDDLDASSGSSDDSDDDSDDEDDEAALQAELAKIRAERDAVKKEQLAKEAAVEEKKLEEAALLGNPLLSGDVDDNDMMLAASGKLKRKWNDDVVFRNQAKGEPEIQKRFINDTVRNDFHKRFLNKFIR